MPELGGNQLLIERMLCPARYRKVAAPSKRNDLQSILQTLTPVNISRNNRKRFDLQFGRVQREQDSHRIIDAWISIDDHSLLRLDKGIREKTEQHKRS
jgi:hypothetical protein